MTFDEILSKFLRKILSSAGFQMPDHVAFIMDGNRTYALNKRISKFTAYSIGCDVFFEQLKFSKSLGIGHITIFLLAEANLNRDTESLAAVMLVIRNLFKRLIREIELGYIKHKVRLLGNTALLEDELIDDVETALNLTKSYEETTLNIALCYSGKRDICATVFQAWTAFKTTPQHYLEKEKRNISLGLIDLNMKPILIIRTSRKYRFSDFIPCQATCGIIHITNKYWPQFTKLDLVTGLFYYHYCYSRLK